MLLCNMLITPGSIGGKKKPPLNISSCILLLDLHGPSTVRALATLPHLNSPYTISPSLPAFWLQKHHSLLPYMQTQWRWHRNSWDGAILCVTLQQTAAISHPLMVTLKVRLWTGQMRPFGWIYCWSNIWRRKMQLEISLNALSWQMMLILSSNIIFLVWKIHPCSWKQWVLLIFHLTLSIEEGLKYNIQPWLGGDRDKYVHPSPSPTLPITAASVSTYLVQIQEQTQQEVVL